jgi:hypothetical protein
VPDLVRERPRWYVIPCIFNVPNTQARIDFCLWAPPKLDDIADSEGEEVAWCSKKGHGTRIMPEGTILGAQLLKTNDYWMITGLINQTSINIQAGDFGGELDSGGQDGVSSLVYHLSAVF